MRLLIAYRNREKIKKYIFFLEIFSLQLNLLFQLFNINSSVMSALLLKLELHSDLNLSRTWIKRYEKIIQSVNKTHETKKNIVDETNVREIGYFSLAFFSPIRFLPANRLFLFPAFSPFIPFQQFPANFVINARAETASDIRVAKSVGLFGAGFRLFQDNRSHEERRSAERTRIAGFGHWFFVRQVREVGGQRERGGRRALCIGSTDRESGTSICTCRSSCSRRENTISLEFHVDATRHFVMNLSSNKNKELYLEILTEGN